MFGAANNPNLSRTGARLCHLHQLRAAKIAVSLNSRLESNKEEEKAKALLLCYSDLL